MKVQCSSCKAIVKETEQICSYCRTPLPKQSENKGTVAATPEFTDKDREAFLSDRKVPQNGSGCMVFILLPIIAAACLWILW